MSSPDRSVPDGCPGALTTHLAADGPLARIRLPGGLVLPKQMQVLARAAEELGDGTVELTSRGNVQLRAVSDPVALASRLAEAGLLPSATHERVRNILASPLSGRVGGLTDVRALVRELDEGLCARRDLAELPGRTLFALDDGRGDMGGLEPDFGAYAQSDGSYALLLAGRDSGVRVDRDSVVPTLLNCAAAFAELRESEWRLAEVDNGVDRIVELLGLSAGTALPLPTPVEVPPIGWLDQDDGLVALAAGLANGVIGARLAEFLAAIDRPVIVTPWRSLIVCDLDEEPAEQVVRVLAPMGLIFDAESPWIRVSACTGSPGCAKSLADVRSDLEAAVEARMTPRDERQHWSGCERRCGRPKGEVTDVIATGIGYQVS
ncbi:precorrin-3B synthase [Rhodococcus sp. 14-2483-1-1]|uniref:precorrin-3B synthase n=1 Tax=unclassified Rhodococcus (in: high G+C Gram-positive bacteria) TaxID=192944 RepID=UPI000B9B8EA4|nr:MULTISPECIES: precorrin-3B synthase [unclassified Rhodococcus (in: high G+C Gram-positive bacteria)]OZC44665.1 precorrin-3B synthase [Rhodococcus sp. WWJCD1]OZF31167.1 precorrin-3B synthase [Rhodococcus sp. 14-2483-1-1]